MADEVMKDIENISVVSFTNGNGEETVLTVDQVEAAILNNKAEQDQFIDKSISYVRYLQPGLMEIDIHPDDPLGVFNCVYLHNHGETAGILPGRYYVLTDKWLDENKTGGFDDDELAAMKTGKLGGLLLASSPDLLLGEEMEALQMFVKVTDEEGNEVENPPYEPIELWLLSEKGTNKYVTTFDLVSALYMMSAVSIAVSVYGKNADSEEIETVELANFKTNESFSNHSLILKTLDEGLFHIAMGNDYFELEPRGGNSNEHYKLTASKGACSDFFKNKGNAEIAKKVLETVYTIMNDERAESFVKNGRIWITLNTIVQEMRRTEAGTISAKDYKNDREMVDRALWAVSGAQIAGLKANGEPINTIYVMNAVRRDQVVYNNQIYNDVWGFETNVTTANDYAKDLGYTHNYPLLKMPKPMTFDEAWIERYLKDALNQARNELYTTDKNGNPKPTKKGKTKVVRAWSAIFERAYPIGEIDSRKKAGIVKKFEKMLTVLANMDCHGELRAGYPMSIKAYSERDAGRGRGGGAWLNLVIECTRETHRPSVNLS